MKTITPKSLFLSLLLVSSVLEIFALSDSEVKNEQKVGITFIVKLYGPLKLQLRTLDREITIVEEKVADVVNLFAAQPQESYNKIKKALVKKLKKITTLREKLGSILQALEHCPLTLKTEAVQQSTDKAGRAFLGNLNPMFIEKRLNEVQKTIENLLDILEIQ